MSATISAQSPSGQENIGIVVSSELIDEIPIVHNFLRQIQLAEAIEQILPESQKNRRGLSFGKTAEILVMYFAWSRTHVLYAAEDFVWNHQSLLGGLYGKSIDKKYLADDRLGDMLDLIGDSTESIDTLNSILSKKILTTYNLDADTVRLDFTTSSVYHEPKLENSIMRRGHSKDNRPDLNQFKIGISCLDPIGMPIMSSVLPGNSSDDNNYVPIAKNTIEITGKTGILIVGDCKLSSIENRSEIEKIKSYYLAPLPKNSATKRKIFEVIFSLNENNAINIYSDDKSEKDKNEIIAKCFEIKNKISASVTSDKTKLNDEIISWDERSVFVMSASYALIERNSFFSKITKAKIEIIGLSTNESIGREVFMHQAKCVLLKYDLSDELSIECSEKKYEKKKYHKKGRPGKNTPFDMETRIKLHVKITENKEEIDKSLKMCGWRMFVTNAPNDKLETSKIVSMYRDQYIIEGLFRRIKSGPVPIRPLYIRKDKRVAGLIQLLVVVLRILTLMEHLVRKKLTEKPEKLEGLYGGNPEGGAPLPTAERIIRSFKSISLYRIRIKNIVYEVAEELTKVQTRVLELLDLPSNLYARLNLVKIQV